MGIAALIGGILTDLTDSKSSTGILTRMVCGLFLAIVVIKPFSNLNFSYLTGFTETFAEAALTASAEGSGLAHEARCKIIKEETEAYILDKARSYQVQLEVRVTLSEGNDPVPESVSLSGAVSPYAKACIQELICTELAIPKERQV